MSDTSITVMYYAMSLIVLLTVNSDVLSFKKNTEKIFVLFYRS